MKIKKKTQKLPKNTQKPKIQKYFKKSCKEASNENVYKTSYNHNWKILRMTFSNNSITQKRMSKTTKKNSTNFKNSYKEATNQKRLENKL